LEKGIKGPCKHKENMRKKVGENGRVLLTENYHLCYDEERNKVRNTVTWKGDNMRKGKISLCMVLIAVLMFGSQVSAASGINVHEQKVLDTLGQSGTTAAGASLSLPTQYINQAVTYLQRDGVDLTETQSKELIAKINEVVALVTATNATKWSEIPADVVAQSIKLAQEAADIIGLTLTFDVASGVLTVKNSSGTTVLTNNQVVKQTGHSLNTLWIGAVTVTLCLAIFALATKKTKMLPVTDQKYAS